MASTSPFTLKWGVMATGGIAKMFVKDFLTDPAVREVSDVRHQLVAVASSTSKQRADEFVEAVAPPAGSPAVSTYGSYAELVADGGPDIIYVATPHSHHFQNAMLALEAGKHVLCEKALTVTAAQTRKLVATARAKKLFFMEAVWTRYFPLSVKVRELVKGGAIGEVHRVFADFSFNMDGGDGKLNLDPGHRLVNPDLAGGALLDLGIYSLTWCFQILYHLQDGEKEKPTVTAAIQKYPSGVDENTTIVLSFPKHRTTGVATTTMRVHTGADKVNTAAPTVRIQGTGGEIQILGLTCRPTSFKVIKRGEGTGPGAVETVECPIPRDPNRQTHNPAIPGFGHGMYWEADECARCLRDGRTESATLPLDESIAIMEVMEEALRQGEVTYPDLITSDVFDAKSPLNTGNT